MLRRSLRVVPLTLAVGALLLASPAHAHGGKKWRHHDHHGHHGHGHGPGHGGYYYAPRYVEHHVHGYPVYYAPEAFFCGPCSHHFASYDDLSYHVHRHHHVAVIALPSVIAHGSFGGGVGWFFDF